MLRYLALTGACAGAMSCASASYAGVLLEESYSGMVDLQSTDWTESLSVPQFDEMGGLRELVSISIFLEGGVSGSAALESLDNAPTKVVAELSAEISISLGAELLGVVIPIADGSFNASAFDGMVDFGGTSGMTFENLAATDSTDVNLTDADAAFAAFLGNGSVKLDGEARGTSFGSGAGNLVLQFTSAAEMAYRITYNYTEIPTPGALAIFAGAGLIALRRRR